MLVLSGAFLFILLPPLIGVLIADLTWGQVAALACAGLLIGGYFTVRDSDAFQSYEWRWTVPPPPPAEAAFIAAAEKLHAVRLAYAKGKAGAPALHQAEAAICRLPPAAKHWVGRITQTYTTDSGRSVSLSVAIRPHVLVRTAFFPDDTHTLIPVHTQPFTALQAAKPGQVVRFDGRVVGHAGACPGEPPIAAVDKLRNPEFLFAFSRLTPAGGR